MAAGLVFAVWSVSFGALELGLGGLLCSGPACETVHGSLWGTAGAGAVSGGSAAAAPDPAVLLNRVSNDDIPAGGRAGFIVDLVPWQP
jgi:hypothetical protein